MFWIFLIAMVFVWFMIPKNDNVWTVLDEKPKRYKWYSESSISKKKYDYKKKKQNDNSNNYNNENIEKA